MSNLGMAQNDQQPFVLEPLRGRADRNRQILLVIENNRKSFDEKFSKLAPPRDIGTSTSPSTSILA